jgi:hypothetical protein
MWRLGVVLAVVSLGCNNNLGPDPDVGPLDGGAGDDPVQEHPATPTPEAGVDGPIDGLVTPTDPVCSEDDWCWQTPIPQGNDLNGVWGNSATDVWVVGGGGTILRWDGTAWSASTSGTHQSFRGAWGNSASDVWAVGLIMILRHYPAGK